METSFTKSVKSSLGKVYRNCILLFTFILSSSKTIFAQEGPSLDNVKKTLQMQEKQAHDEFMSYVYMVLGFAVVIAIAWISTVKARNRTKAENEAKIKFIQQNLANKKHHTDPHHGHSLHKARR